MKQLILVTLLSFPLWMTNCQSDSQETVHQASPVKVKVMQIRSAGNSHAQTYSGTVEESNEMSLSFAVAGTIQQINVQTGDHVRAGQLIATIHAASYNSSYKAAQASLEQAQDAYKRMKELYEKGSLPEIKWIETQSKLQQAQSIEEIARKNLEDCNLYAPFNGVIAEKTAESGQNTMPGMPVVKLVAVNQLKVKVAVPETEIASISLSQPAQIEVPALNGQTFQGTVIEKGIVANPLSRSYDVKIRINEADKELMPGMVTEVSLTNADGNSQFILPAHLVQLNEKNQTFVWINENGTAKRRFISCGDYTATGVIVLSGLNNGDEIITEGQQKVCENTMLSL